MVVTILLLLLIIIETTNTTTTALASAAAAAAIIIVIFIIISSSSMAVIIIVISIIMIIIITSRSSLLLVCVAGAGLDWRHALIIGAGVLLCAAFITGTVVVWKKYLSSQNSAASQYTLCLYLYLCVCERGELCVCPVCWCRPAAVCCLQHRHSRSVEEISLQPELRSQSVHSLSLSLCV